MYNKLLELIYINTKLTNIERLFAFHNNGTDKDDWITESRVRAPRVKQKILQMRDLNTYSSCGVLVHQLSQLDDYRILAK